MMLPFFGLLLTIIAYCNAGRILVNKDHFHNRIEFIQNGIVHFDKFINEATKNTPIAVELLEHLENNSKAYEKYLQHTSENGTESEIFIYEMKLFDPFGIQNHTLNLNNVVRYSEQPHQSSIHELYGLGSNHKRRVKRGVPAIIGGIVGGGIGGCLGTADLFFLPLVGGLLGGLFGGGAGAGLGGTIFELNPLSGPLNSVLGGLVASLFAAIGGGIGGLAGPIGGCAAGGAGGAIGGGVGTIIGTILQTFLGGPI